MDRVVRAICYLLYYGLVRWLPPSASPGGFVWRAIRRAVCRPMFASCGRNVNVERSAFFRSGRLITIGDNSGIGRNATIEGEVEIGANVMMGPDVVVMTQNHAFDRVDVPMIEQGMTTSRRVRIDDDVWIGTRAIILPGVHVGRGSIVGAGAVVTKSVPPLSVVAGNPARVVRARDARREALHG